MSIGQTDKKSPELGGTDSFASSFRMVISIIRSFAILLIDAAHRHLLLTPSLDGKGSLISTAVRKFSFALQYSRFFRTSTLVGRIRPARPRLGVQVIPLKLPVPEPDLD